MQGSTVSRISLEASCRATESLQNLFLGKAITGSAPSSSRLEVNCGSYSTCLPKTEVIKEQRKSWLLSPLNSKSRQPQQRPRRLACSSECEQWSGVFRESRRL